MKKYDCIIIGGGISGLTFGILSLKKKRNVLIVEKRNPKTTDKLCGGLLTKKSLNILKSVVDLDNLKITHHDIAKVHNDKKEITIDVDIYTINRHDLDQSLLNTYQKLGGEILIKTSYDNIDIKHNTIRINNKNYRYEKLIVADGVNSSIRKKITGRAQRKNFALEVTDKKNRDLEIYFSSNYKGYSWIIPNSKNNMIGLGDVSGATDIMSNFEEYLKFLKIHKYDLRGAYLPSGDDFFFQYDNVYFIGDAAGLCSPLTGEGIYYALLSASILSENLNKKYASSMRKHLLNLRIAKFYSKFVYSLSVRNLFFNHYNFFFFRWCLQIFIKLML